VSTSGTAPRTVFGRLPVPERAFLADALRQETTGGILLLIAAVLGLVAANSGLADEYERLAHWKVGPDALGLHISLQHWAGDGLLAIFFFIAGLELKRELVVGTLKDRAQAVLPIVAAACGMAVPALVFVVIAWGSPGATQGWAIPVATDIAFALAVLAIVGRSLPPSLRAFLLTLAVVDDMGAITIIAIFYTSSISVGPLVGAVVGLVLYAYLQRRRVQSWVVYVPLALGVWTLVHASGIHATIAGVALGLLTRVRPDADEDHSPAERLEHRLRPLSAAVAVPIFAFFSTGVVLSAAAFQALAHDRVAYGIVLGLVVGKFVGVFGGTWLAVRLTRAELSEELAWRDIAAVGLLAGIGFTVSLLIAELAFEDDPGRLDLAKTAVLIGSVLSALLASLLLRSRSTYYRTLAEREGTDADGAGIPDVDQAPPLTGSGK
jgi:Na+:H+ antiporter, NhaA family